MLRRVKHALVLLVAVAMVGVTAQPTEAGSFRRTTTIAGTYLMGTSNLAEYDYWAELYPDYIPQFGFTFYRNGSVDIFDSVGGTESGVYNRFGPGNSRVTVTLTSTTSPWGTVTYHLYRVGNSTDWWGEVRIDGIVYGHFRGVLDD